MDPADVAVHGDSHWGHRTFVVLRGGDAGGDCDVFHDDYVGTAEVAAVVAAAAVVVVEENMAEEEQLLEGLGDTSVAK